jgi:hypothetical protein
MKIKAGIDVQKLTAGECFIRRLGPKTILFLVWQEHLPEKSQPYSEVAAKNS